MFPCFSSAVFWGYFGSTGGQLGVLTFFDESPWSEQGVVQFQAGEELVFLEALVQPPDDGGDGSVAEPERSGGKHIGH